MIPSMKSAVPAHAVDVVLAASIEIPPPQPSTVPLPPTPPAGPEPAPPEIEEPPLQPGEPIREPHTPPPMANGTAAQFG